MLETITKTLRKETRVCIAAGMTTKDEYIRTLTVEQWKKAGEIPIQKVPAIFLIYK